MTCSDFRIDRKAGIIYNVLILGNKAKNGRRYLKEAKEDAVERGLYENLQVYIGPHKKGRFAKRSPSNHAGELRNVKVMPNEEVRGDLHYNRVSYGGRLLLEIADRFPERFGLSQHGWVDGYEENGEKLITEIAELAVVDLIKDPGTTTNIFEDVDMADEVAEDAVDTPPDAVATDDAPKGWKASIKTLIGEIHDDDSIDDDVKMQATKLAMKLKALLEGDEEPADDNPEPTPAEEEVTLETLLKKLNEQDAKIEKLSKQPAKAPRPPKSTAKSEATEEVTPKPEDKPKPKVLKTEAEVLDAYDADNDE